MVLRFTATVKKREVRVRDVDLPDGATVDVTIARQQEEDDNFDLTPEQWAEVRAAERRIDRGEYYTGEEVRAWLLDGQPLPRADGRPRPGKGGTSRCGRGS